MMNLDGIGIITIIILDYIDEYPQFFLVDFLDFPLVGSEPVPINAKDAPVVKFGESEP